jgi:hypothetical protein
MSTPPGEWKRDDLKSLSAAELRALAELLGIPVSGTKAECVDRLLSLGSLRQLLADFDGPDVREVAERLAEAYFKKELKGMASMAKIWKSGSKIQLALGLIMWRNECRRKGQENLTKARAELKSRPRQLSLPYAA